MENIELPRRAVDPLDEGVDAMDIDVMEGMDIDMDGVAENKPEKYDEASIPPAFVEGEEEEILELALLLTLEEEEDPSASEAPDEMGILVWV